LGGCGIAPVAAGGLSASAGAAANIEATARIVIFCMVEAPEMRKALKRSGSLAGRVAFRLARDTLLHCRKFSRKKRTFVPFAMSSGSLLWFATEQEKPATTCLIAMS
jgi:hypothetical protein